jgi:hypothetical protein
MEVLFSTSKALAIRLVPFSNRRTSTSLMVARASPAPGRFGKAGRLRKEKRHHLPVPARDRGLQAFPLFGGERQGRIRTEFPGSDIEGQPGDRAQVPGQVAAESGIAGEYRLAHGEVLRP